MAIEKKGMLSPFTVFTSIITGGFFPLLGSFFAGIFLEKIYWTGVVLTAIGGFIAHYVLAHTIHDIFHYELGQHLHNHLQELSHHRVLKIEQVSGKKFYTHLQPLHCLWGKGLAVLFQS